MLILPACCITLICLKTDNFGVILEHLRLGVIGVGHLGRFHALNYAQIPEISLVGVTDTDLSRARQIAVESQSRAYETVDGLLQDVDAVSVAVPTDIHFDIVSFALESGRHVLVEKPISQTVEQADQLISLADSNKLILHVGQIERFNPALSVLRHEKIDPKFIEAHRLAPFNPRGTEVAVILDLMIHDIDVVLSLVKSPVVSVDASGVAVVSDTVDIANARIRFENDAVANLTSSRISQKKMRKMRLFQKDRYISIDFDAKISEIYQLETDGSGADLVLGEIGVGENKKKITYQKPGIPDEVNALRIELEAFAQAVSGLPSTGVSGREGRDALQVAQIILDKMEA